MKWGCQTAKNRIAGCYDPLRSLEIDNVRLSFVITTTVPELYDNTRQADLLRISPLKLAIIYSKKNTD